MIILYAILAICTCALLCVGIAMYLRVRRLTRASETQFCRALQDDAPQQQAKGQPAENRAASAPELRH